MSDPTRPLPHSEREARRALLHEALVELASTDHPERAADDVLRALDAYVDGHGGLEPREPPVMEFSQRPALPAPQTTRWGLWLAILAAMAATIAVAITISGTHLAAIVIIAIWVVAALAITLS